MPRQNNLFPDLNTLDLTIEKLERIKKLLEEINALQGQCIEHNRLFDYPVRPEPMPYIPQPSRTNDPPWSPLHKIWCCAEDKIL